MFDGMFGFEYATNCFIPSREYMPRGYGQLGCSGFIVVDLQGNFVSRKTAAFLNHGEAAFRQVESILTTLVSPSPSAAPPTTIKCALVAGKGPASDERMDGDAIPELGIASMDEEHKRCDEALKMALEKPTLANLKAALDEVQNHFAHEEGLLVLHGFGGNPTDPFSALASHIKDHKRILSLVEASIQNGSKISNDCNNGS